MWETRRRPRLLRRAFQAEERLALALGGRAVEPYNAIELQEVNLMAAGQTQSGKEQVTLLLNRLTDAWVRSKWHSFEGALEGLTEEEAAWRPEHYRSPEPWDFSGSILDILIHVAIDSLVMPDQAFGDRTLTAEAIWKRFQAEGGDLAAALALLEEGYKATRRSLAHLTDCDLQRKVGTQKERGAESLFVEMIEHYLYHAGQINYIRCLWEGARTK
jgi:uncharacterized damage-inducible protein DinB